MCIRCGVPTLHAEDAVSDVESATVWHCLICGEEKRPGEPGTPNEPASGIINPPGKEPGEALVV